MFWWWSKEICKALANFVEMIIDAGHYITQPQGYTALGV
jgi:hypothetical protein